MFILQTEISQIAIFKNPYSQPHFGIILTQGKTLQVKLKCLKFETDDRGFWYICLKVQAFIRNPNTFFLQSISNEGCSLCEWCQCHCVRSVCSIAIFKLQIASNRKNDTNVRRTDQNPPSLTARSTHIQCSPCLTSRDIGLFETSGFSCFPIHLQCLTLTF